MGNLRIRDFDSLFTPIEHSSYHFTYNLNALWTTVMENQTLADLVAGIFTGVSSALASVKSGLEAAWDGIKSAGQFIGNAVLQPIASSIQQLGKNLLRGFLTAISSISDFSVSEVQDSFNLQLGNISASTGVRLSGLSLIFELGESQYVLSVVDLLKNSVETLGVGQDVAFQQMKQILDMYILSLGLLVLGLATLLIGIGIPLLFWSLMTSLMAFVDSIGILFIPDNISLSVKKEYASWMGSFYGTMKDLFSGVAFFGLPEEIGGKIVGGWKTFTKIMKILGSIPTISGVVNIFTANYPSYIMDRLIIFFIMLTSLLILGFYVIPVAVGVLAYSIVNAAIFALLEIYARGLA